MGYGNVAPAPLICNGRFCSDCWSDPPDPQPATPAPMPATNTVAIKIGRIDFMMPILADFDFRERGHLELDDFGRKRRVAELARELLSVRQRPLHEVEHDLRLRFVFGVLEQEQPREG